MAEKKVPHPISNSQQNQPDEDKPTLYLDKFQLDRLSEYAFAVEGVANVTKREEYGNIGYTLEIICNGILDLWEELRKQELGKLGGERCQDA
jgi:hypothetical protein